MKITLNGEETNVDDGTKLVDLLSSFSIKDDPVAAQVNDDIIRHEDFSTRTLKDGDVVELFRMMGGG